MISRIGEGEGKVNAAAPGGIRRPRMPPCRAPRGVGAAANAAEYGGGGISAAFAQWYAGAAMIVIRADTLGLCGGVRRALRLAEQALADNPGGSFFSLGPLAHNPRLVEVLRTRGITPVEELSAVREGFLIIRTHGIGPAERRECEKPGVTIIDATCPTVRRIHGEVLAYSSQGFSIVIAGDPGHAEVKGIAGHARRAGVVASRSQAETIALSGQVLLVAQTTFDRGEYNIIRDILVKRKPDIVVRDTLCPEIDQREDGVRRLASRVEALLVIGGRQSANTRRLYTAATASGRPSWQVEGAAEIPAGIGRFAKVGITAGASTPDFVIDEVEAALRALAP
jgi:4-hydroxy-3-methylbut-2-en-1-yl diphosphate reductase